MSSSAKKAKWLEQLNDKPGFPFKYTSNNCDNIPCVYCEKSFLGPCLPVVWFILGVQMWPKQMYHTLSSFKLQQWDKLLEIIPQNLITDC